MGLQQSVVTSTLRGLTNVLCRVNDEQLAKVPERGPCIIVANHVNFVEVPIMATRLHPRPVTGFAKEETWDNPAMGYLFNLWDGIPIKRGEADMGALRKGLEVLDKGYFLAIAPEGTRSNDGRLQPAHPGVAVLALLSGVPLLPIVYYGGEQLKSNLRRLRRTDFRIIVGDIFSVDDRGEKVTSQVRSQMANEIMYQLAALLPPAYRGHYANLEMATERYLRFEPPSKSNLRGIVE
jgi:1-acyl-sn-glycerol-3-phosphate acyltransferase